MHFGYSASMARRLFCTIVLLLGSAMCLLAQNRPPLEGPLTRIALTLTDDATIDVADFLVTYRPSYSGSQLAAATSSFALAVLDTGAATHLISYPDSELLGIDATWRTANTFPVGGAGGTVNIDISQPLGVFVHGAQDVDTNGQAQTTLMVGEGNCPVGVNTEANFLAGSALPSVIGMPLLPFYPVEVLNSALLEINHQGETLTTAEAVFYTVPSGPPLPTYTHRVPLRFVPAGSPDVLWLFDPFTIPFTPTTPSVVGSGALLETASTALTLTEGAYDATANLVFDTAAQATLISETIAFDLGFILASPDFEIELEGIGGTEMVPGFYVDSLRIPTSAGGMTWSNVPVVVRNITGPEASTIDGILGSNLLGNRDYLVNAAAASPYLEFSAYTIAPDPRVTAIRRGTNDAVEMDWFCQPAGPEVFLEMSENPALGPTSWSVVSTGEFGSITGTIAVTNPPPAAVFRFAVPDG